MLMFNVLLNDHDSKTRAHTVDLFVLMVRDRKVQEALAVWVPIGSAASALSETGTIGLVDYCNTIVHVPAPPFALWLDQLQLLYPRVFFMWYHNWYHSDCRSWMFLFYTNQLYYHRCFFSKVDSTSISGWSLYNAAMHPTVSLFQALWILLRYTNVHCT